jgi:hypothetical protein
LEELVLYLKIGGSQADFQQLHDGFDLQDRPFCQCDIVVEQQSRCLPSPEDGNRSSFRNVVFFHWYLEKSG